MFDDAVKDTKAEMDSQGRGDEFIGARIIYSTIRCITPEELEWYLTDCIQLKLAYPNLIAGECDAVHDNSMRLKHLVLHEGFDLVGDENELHPLLYYTEPLLRFRKRVEELKLDLPFVLHAGETLGDGSPADNNLYDAILLGTKRIGHG